MQKEKFYVISGCNCHSEYNHRENIKCLIPISEIEAKKELIQDSETFIKYYRCQIEVTFQMRFYFYSGKEEHDEFDGSIHDEVLDAAETGQIIEMFYGDIYEDIQGSEEGTVTVENSGSLNFKKVDSLNGDEYFTEHHATLEMILKD